MEIWIFNHYAQDNTIPGGTRHFDLARHLIAQGHNVTIFSAGFHYTLLKETADYQNKTYSVDIVDGVKFIRVKTYKYKVNNIKRLLNMASYALRLNFLIPKINLNKPEVIIGTTIHPFAPLVAYKFSKKYNTPFVFEIRDLWPQTLIDMGVWRKNDLISIFFRFIEGFTVKRSSGIISLSPKTAEYLKDKYNYSEGCYIPNGVDIESIASNVNLPEISPTISEVQALKNRGKFLCIFVGAIVRSNNIGMFIDTAKKINNDDVFIVLVGQGQERVRYERAAIDKGLKNIIFLDPVEKRLVPKLLNLADALLLIQDNVQWGSSNKLYDYLAAGKPIITSLYASHNNIIEDIECGYASRHGDGSDMARKIDELRRLSPSSRRDMAHRAFSYVSRNHDTSLMAKKLESYLKELLNKGQH